MHFFSCSESLCANEDFLPDPCLAADIVSVSTCDHEDLLPEACVAADAVCCIDFSYGDEPCVATPESFRTVGTGLSVVDEVSLHIAVPNSYCDSPDAGAGCCAHPVLVGLHDEADLPSETYAILLNFDTVNHKPRDVSCLEEEFAKNLGPAHIECDDVSRLTTGEEIGVGDGIACVSSHGQTCEPSTPTEPPPPQPPSVDLHEDLSPYVDVVEAVESDFVEDFATAAVVPFEVACPICHDFYPNRGCWCCGIC